MAERNTHQSDIQVVILEDADTTRDGLVLHLAVPGITILGASPDPGTILTLVQMHQPAIAILDLRIYGDDQAGFTIARRIAQISPATRCIIYTEHDTAANQIAALEAGAACCISKVPRGSQHLPIATLVSSVAHGYPRENSSAQPIKYSLAQPQLDLSVGPKPDENPLTLREQETLYWIGEGLSTEEIAEEMVVQPSTVKRHLQDAFDKLHIRRRWPAMERARKQGWISTPGSIVRRQGNVRRIDIAE